MSKQELVNEFWKDKNLTDDEKYAMLVDTCRKVFSTVEGKIVLNMLLYDFCVFRRTHDHEEQALNEYGKFFIRERLGVSNMKSLTDFIAETALSGGR